MSSLKRKKYFWSGVLFLLCILVMPVRADAGWVRKGGYRYYYTESGKMLRCRKKKIGKATYYFDKKGRMLKNTMKTVKGKQYYFGRNGKAVKGWLTLDGSKYYFNAEGVGAKGLVAIGKNSYYFAEDGKMQTGWQYFGTKKAYFQPESGRMAVNREIDGQKINKKGYAKMTNADKSMLQALEKAEAILQSVTSPGMSRSQKLRVAYDYMTSKTRFSYATWQSFSEYDGWIYDYANQIYDRRAGNCYNFACGFAVLAKVIGYEPNVILGRIHGSRDGAADGFTRHAFVQIDGCYYDPELKWAGEMDIYGYGGYPLTWKYLGTRAL
jgi:hypothetical protein